jgi:hypothetical protein
MMQSAGQVARPGEPVQRVSLTKVHSRHSLLSDPAAVDEALGLA